MKNDKLMIVGYGSIGKFKKAAKGIGCQFIIPTARSLPRVLSLLGIHRITQIKSCPNCGRIYGTSGNEFCYACREEK